MSPPPTDLSGLVAVQADQIIKERCRRWRPSSVMRPRRDRSYEAFSKEVFTVSLPGIFDGCIP